MDNKFYKHCTFTCFSAIIDTIKRTDALIAFKSLFIFGQILLEKKETNFFFSVQLFIKAQQTSV